MDNVYIPGSRLTKLYVPDSLVSSLDTTPVFTSVAVTVTPGIRAPDSSCTVPLTRAKLACAKAEAIRLRHNMIVAVNVRII